MKLVFLGRYRDLAGASGQDEALPAEIRDLTALRRWLGRTRPGLAPALEGSCTVVINQILVRDPFHPVADNDEIAFLPPMSGG